MQPSKYSEFRDWMEDAGVAKVNMEMREAVSKHGFDRTPASNNIGDATKLITLVEEVGEVARSLTYDEADFENLKDELLQVATMSLAWLYSLQELEKDAQEPLEGQGLRQLAGPTFSDYQAGQHKAEIYDPAANIQAAIGYIKSTYGVPLSEFDKSSYLKTKTNDLEPPH